MRERRGTDHAHRPGANCGSCLGMAAEMVEQMRAELPLPILAAAA
jgi:hypothetical protein